MTCFVTRVVSPQVSQKSLFRSLAQKSSLKQEALVTQTYSKMTVMMMMVTCKLNQSVNIVFSIDSVTYIVPTKVSSAILCTKRKFLTFWIKGLRHEEGRDSLWPVAHSVIRSQVFKCNFGNDSSQYYHQSRAASIPILN